MYDKAIKLDPYNPMYYNNRGKWYLKYLGNSLFDLKQYEEAILMYNKARELD